MLQLISSASGPYAEALSQALKIAATNRVQLDLCVTLTVTHKSRMCGEANIYKMELFIRRMSVEIGDARDHNPYPEDEMDPLCVAAKYGHLDLVKHMIEKTKVKPNHPDENGVTPLLVASRNGRLNVVKYLVEEVKVNPSQIDKFGWTPMFNAAEYGHVNVVKYFVEELKMDPCEQDKDGETLVHIASEYGHINVLEYLLMTLKIDPIQLSRDMVNDVRTHHPLPTFCTKSIKISSLLLNAGALIVQLMPESRSTVYRMIKVKIDPATARTRVARRTAFLKMLKRWECHRQWGRVFNADSGLTAVPDVMIHLLSHPQQLQLFFNKLPGLMRLVGRTMMLYYDNTVSFKQAVKPKQRKRKQKREKQSREDNKSTTA